jgi:ATP-binding cassette, subfamily F, member 3
MIRIKSISLARGATLLLEDASATINTGERIALLGPNGSGKSSLLAALSHDLLLDAGEIEMAPGRLVRLEQSLAAGPQVAWRHVFNGDAALVAAELELQRAEPEGGIALAEAHDHWIQLGGHSVQSQIRELLDGLGFSALQADQSVDSLSGGWRMRLNLARALFVPGEYLFLDEPTNHLDLDAIVWLERWLIRYPGTLLVVSHDRDFLDRIATATLSIEARKLVRYAGGYSAFEQQRAQRLVHAAKQATEQAQRIAHLTSFIERFRAKATKARQVQSRVKALEKLAIAAPARVARPVDFSLPDATDAPDPLIVCEELAAGYGEKAVLSGVDLTIGKGARIGLLGRNGAGKSTLIRTLVGELPRLSGELQRARSMRIGYFDQQGVEQLRPDDSPLAMLRRKWPDATEALLRGELGRFGFGGESALRPIGPMSGGEKARLVLAMTIRARPHLLVLDEPTNHLDADTRDALTEALADFDGALLLVSHDRYLMRATVDQLTLVHDGQVERFDGDLDDYLEWLQRSQSPAGKMPSDDAGQAAALESRTGVEQQRKGAARPATVDRKEERRQEANRRQQLAQRLKPLDAELKRTEAELTALEAELASLEVALIDPLLYDDTQRAADLSRRQASLTRQREDLEWRWLETSQRREQLARED